MTDADRLSGTVEVRRAGDRAVLLVPDDPARVLDLAEALRAQAPAGVVDILPAAETVMVLLEPGVEVSEWDIGPFESRQPGVAQEPLTIPVRYDGPDLAEVAAAVGLSPDELIARHTDVTWRCGFVGFAPGFGYLVSADWDLPIPPGDTAHHGARRFGGAGSRILGRVPEVDTGRLAAHRHHRPRGVRCRPQSTRLDHRRTRRAFRSRALTF